MRTYQVPLRIETIRLRLFKVGARVVRSVRRLFISFASGYPWKDVFRAAYRRIIQTQPLLHEPTRPFEALDMSRQGEGVVLPRGLRHGG